MSAAISAIVMASATTAVAGAQATPAPSCAQPAPPPRGINSIQLYNDGTRWWVLNLMWEAERADNKLPDKYLRSVAPSR